MPERPCEPRRRRPRASGALHVWLAVVATACGQVREEGADTRATSPDGGRPDGGAAGVASGGAPSGGDVTGGTAAMAGLGGGGAGGAEVVPTVEIPGLPPPPSCDDVFELPTPVDCLEGPAGVFDGDAWILAQGDVVALSGYREITGNLDINPTEPVDLAALGCLERVGGRVTIGAWLNRFWNDALPSLRGLEGLREVDTLQIGVSTALTDLTGLENLTSVRRVQIEAETGLVDAAHLRISGAPVETIDVTGDILRRGPTICAAEVATVRISGVALQDVGYWGGLTRVTDGVSISGGQSLNQLTSLSYVDTIGGSLSLSGLPGLTSLESVAGLASVGSLSLSSLAIATLADLSGIQVRESLFLQNDDVLSDLSGVVLADGASIFITDASALRSLEGLGVPARLSSITLKHNPALGDLGPLSAVTQVDGDIILEDLGGLVDLGGLDGLGRVTGTLAIVFNPVLERLSSLGAVEVATLQIFGNPMLSHCEAARVANLMGTTCTDTELFPDICSGVCTCNGNDNTGTCP